MSTKTYRTIFLLFILTSSSLGIKAQDTATFSPNKVYWWGGAHIGGGTYHLMYGLNAGVLIRNKVVIALSTDESTKIFSRDDTRDARVRSLLLGYKLTQRPKSNLALLSGISAVKFTDRGLPTGPPTFTYGPERNFTQVGVPVMFKYTLVPASVVGMDFSAGMNFNSHRNFFQISFGVSIGHLRDK